MRFLDRITCEQGILRPFLDVINCLKYAGYLKAIKIFKDKNSNDENLFRKFFYFTEI